MSKDEDDKKESIPVFRGNKDDYPVFIIRFETWEQSQKVGRATEKDHGHDLVTRAEYSANEREDVDPADPTKMKVRPLTKEELQMYEDNAKSLNKMTRCLDSGLIVSMWTAAGEKKSMYFVKQWLKAEFGEETIEESYPELSDQLQNLVPSDYDAAYRYTAALENLNDRIGQIAAKYKYDHLQLMAQILSKIPENNKKEVNPWGNFKSEYRKPDKLSRVGYLDFKKHFKREWDAVGAPGIVRKETDKSLNVQLDGAKYFPGKCSKCNKTGHKAADCRSPDKRKGGKNQQQKSGDTKQFKGTCFTCNKTGHRAKDCPGKTEVTLSVASAMVPEAEVEDEFFDDFCIEESDDEVLDSGKPLWWFDACDEESDLEDDFDFVGSVHEFANIPACSSDGGNTKHDAVHECMEAFCADRFPLEPWSPAVNTTLEEAYAMGDHLRPIWGSFDASVYGERSSTQWMDQYWETHHYCTEVMMMHSCFWQQRLCPKHEKRDDEVDDDATDGDLTDSSDGADGPRDANDDEVDAGDALDDPMDSDDPVEMVMATTPHPTHASDAKRLLLDSGSTINAVRSSAGVHKLRACTKTVYAATKNRAVATTMGDLKFTCGNDSVHVVLTETHVIPEFMNDIVSLPRLLHRGCTIVCGCKQCFQLRCPNGKVLQFD